MLAIFVIHTEAVEFACDVGFDPLKKVRKTFSAISTERVIMESIHEYIKGREVKKS